MVQKGHTGAYSSYAHQRTLLGGRSHRDVHNPREEDPMADGKARQKLISTFKRWQEVEDEAINSTAEIISHTRNPLVLLVMDIIQSDSQRHHWVLDMMAETLETGSLYLTREELSEISDLMSRHARLEQNMASAVKEAFDQVRKEGLVLLEYLLKYLTDDENKHLSMLERLTKLNDSL